MAEFINIYGIENVDNGKHYIGCTKEGNMRKRWREHRCLLRSGQHASVSLQQDWNASEESKFVLRHLATWCVPDVASKRVIELEWMDRFSERGLLYNERRISFQPPPGVGGTRKGQKNSPESNLKRRLAQLGIPKGHGAKISATKQARKNK